MDIVHFNIYQYVVLGLRHVLGRRGITAINPTARLDTAVMDAASSDILAITGRQYMDELWRWMDAVVHAVVYEYLPYLADTVRYAYDNCEDVIMSVMSLIITVIMWLSFLYLSFNICCFIITRHWARRNS
nr:uncharacterized protein LOC123757024 [Procambarus clarkii]